MCRAVGGCLLRLEELEVIIITTVDIIISSVITINLIISPSMITTIQPTL